MAVTWPAKNNYATGDVLTAANMNGIGDDLNDIQNQSFFAGKNKIINGDFRWNQRAFTSTTTSGTYGFDRWNMSAVDGTVTYSAQTFSTGTAPVAGYESINFAREVTTGQTLATARATIQQSIEDVRTFAGQTVTISFWAKAASGTPKVAIELNQSFGTGGSPSTGVTTYAGQVTLSTSWARYSATIAVPSISGKTIGTDANSSSLQLNLWTSAGSNFNSRTGSLGIQSNTFDFWGVQVEAGTAATAFQTATGTIQGELAACQRYLPAFNSNGTGSTIGSALANTTTLARGIFQFQVQPRVAPTGITISNTGHFSVQFANTFTAGTNLTWLSSSQQAALLELTTTGLTAGQGGMLYSNNASGQILFTGCEL